MLLSQGRLTRVAVDGDRSSPARRSVSVECHTPLRARVGCKELHRCYIAHHHAIGRAHAPLMNLTSVELTVTDSLYGRARIAALTGGHPRALHREALSPLTSTTLTLRRRRPPHRHLPTCCVLIVGSLTSAQHVASSETASHSRGGVGRLTRMRRRRAHAASIAEDVGKCRRIDESR
jgi:hypothetical protein